MKAPVLVAVNMRVEIELLSKSGEADPLTVVIVADEQADFAAGFLGAGTQLAQAILGQPVGAEVPYPVADMRAVRILSAAPSEDRPAEDVAARREAVVREAVNRANLDNALMVATSVNNKWGDYDADSPAPEGWDEKK